MRRSARYLLVVLRGAREGAQAFIELCHPQFFRLRLELRDLLEGLCLLDLQLERIAVAVETCGQFLAREQVDMLLLFLRERMRIGLLLTLPQRQLPLLL